MVSIARDFCAGIPEIRVVQADARQLPFAARSFDFVTCSLLLHHLSEDDTCTVLRNMRLSARYGIVLSDLIRSNFGYGAAWLATRLVSRNRLTRHDGPLSVRRAYSLAELQALMRRAGCGQMKTRQHLLIRMSATEEVHSEPYVATGIIDSPGMD